MAAPALWWGWVPRATKRVSGTIKRLPRPLGRQPTGRRWPCSASLENRQGGPGEGGAEREAEGEGERGAGVVRRGRLGPLA
jgi:hypothetical protein